MATLLHIDTHGVMVKTVYLHLVASQAFPAAIISIRTTSLLCLHNLQRNKIDFILSRNIENQTIDTFILVPHISAPFKTPMAF